jgi:methylated-DNA-[protein]-cysteine S-methyltransferase
MKFKNNILKDFNGTDFQILVWKEILKIPYGETRTYKEIAQAIGRPNSSRAVANACGKNPYAPDIPCHRVIRSDGKLGGYSGVGGVKMKEKLLKMEILGFNI